MLPSLYKALVQPLVDAARFAASLLLFLALAALVAAALFLPLYLLLELPAFAQALVGLACVLLGLAWAAHVFHKPIDHQPLRGRPLSPEKKGR